MNTRKMIVEAILAFYRDTVDANKELVVEESLRRITSDATLIAFAIDLGIDTDAILTPAVRS